jgi:hypothetical protein
MWMNKLIGEKMNLLPMKNELPLATQRICEFWEQLVSANF